MRLPYLFPIFTLFCLTSCGIEDDSPRQEIKTELLTAIIGPCEGEPIYINPVPSGEGDGTYFPSMHIKFGDDEWQTYPTYFIVNFEFEPGY